MIAALAIDRVAQLLIRYYECDIRVPNISAGIPIRNAFDEIGQHIGPGITTTSFAFQSAINAGIFNPEAVKMSFACPTGNCTFSDTYSTLGCCSSCIDATSNLTKTCYSEEATISGESYVRTRCTTSLPGSFHLDSSPANSMTFFAMSMNGSSDDTVQMIFHNGTAIPVPDGLNCSAAPHNSTAPCINAEAATCRLYPCVRTYRASIKDNALTEDLVSTSAELALGFFPEPGLATIDNKCLSPSERQSLVNIGYAINETTDWIPYHGNGYLANSTQYSEINPNVPNATFTPRCLYAIYEASLSSIDHYVGIFFNGTVTSNPAGYIYDVSGPAQVVKVFDGGFINFTSVNASFANVADSMTAYIRTNNATSGSLQQPSNTTTVNGEVYRTDTCIEVRWGYLAFPIVLVAITLVFFLAMIIQTGRLDGDNDWKSSPLPLLFHGLNDGIRDRQDDLLRVDEMQSVAAATHVRLRRKDAGWEFAQKD